MSPVRLHDAHVRSKRLHLNLRRAITCWGSKDVNSRSRARSEFCSTHGQTGHHLESVVSCCVHRMTHSEWLCLCRHKHLTFQHKACSTQQPRSLKGAARSDYEIHIGLTSVQREIPRLSAARILRNTAQLQAPCRDPPWLKRPKAYEKCDETIAPSV